MCMRWSRREGLLPIGWQRKASWWRKRLSGFWKICSFLKYLEKKSKTQSCRAWDIRGKKINAEEISVSLTRNEKQIMSNWQVSWYYLWVSSLCFINKRLQSWLHFMRFALKLDGDHVPLIWPPKFWVGRDKAVLWGGSWFFQKKFKARR